MVIKAKHTIEIEPGIRPRVVWEFIDGVEKLTMDEKQKSEEGKVTRTVHYERKGDYCHDTFEEMTFLLNDTGGTIERII